MSGDVQRADRDRTSRALIRRPRLLDRLAERLHRRVVVVSAGAGFGKSTLLAQSLADATVRERTHDVVHRVTAADPDGSAMVAAIARGIATVASELDGDAPAPATDPSVSLADRLWHLSPTHVSVVVDDAHLLADSGWAALDELVGDLPTNACLVVFCRGAHRLRLARLLARDEALEVTEPDLAFTPEELDEFARLRGADVTTLDEHGWPALAELQVAAGRSGARRFVTEEVLSQLDAAQHELLARLAVRTPIDQELVAAFDPTRAVDDLVADLPLTVEIEPGVWSVHDLLRNELLAGLDADVATDARRRVAEVLRRRGEPLDALALAVEAADDSLIRGITLDVGRELLVDAGDGDGVRHPVALRRALVDLLPDERRDSAEVALLRADLTAVDDPPAFPGALQDAIDRATGLDVPEVTALALLRLGDLAYRTGDVDGLAGARERLGRLERLAGDDADAAAAAMAMVDSWLHLLDNAPAKAMAALDTPTVDSYDPVRVMADYYRAVQLGYLGDTGAALTALDRFDAEHRGRYADRVRGFAGLLHWWRGDGEAVSSVGEGTDRSRRPHFAVEVAATEALVRFSAGDARSADRALRRADARRREVGERSWAAITHELALGVRDLMDGDEAATTARLTELLERRDPLRGVARHVFGNVGALLYALVPTSRDAFDAEEERGDLTLGTDVGRALVALRERSSPSLAARLPWDDVARLRTWAFEPHLSELALGAIADGRHAARAAIGLLRHEPRAVLRAAADRHGGAIAAVADELLAQTPHRPRRTVFVDTLGPTRIRSVEPGVPTTAEESSISRKMVRELLLLLVHRRRISRDEAAALLWPDKDEASARNNLRSNLSSLRGLLESAAGVDASDDAPPWHLRSDAETIELFSSEHLQLDVDAFDDAISRARRADAERRPADALDGYRAALAVARGDYLVDAVDADWAFNERMARHLAVVGAATRASELELAVGATEAAIDHARRAVDEEPLDERAHRALVRALLASGERAGARRAVDRALRLLADDGLTPDAETVRLADDVGGHP